MEALIEDYEKEDVFFFHTLGGDQDLPDVHFKKHYRLSYPVVADNLDRCRHIIRVTGITNVAVFGGDRVCVFNKSQVAEDEKGFREAIDGALKELGRGEGLRRNAFVEKGTVYAPAVEKEGRLVRERFPRLAAGEGAELHLVFNSDEAGTEDVFLRTRSGGRWGKDVAVAATDADEYAPVVVALDEGRALVAYVGQAKGRYEVFTVTVADGKASKPKQVSRSRDDAMAPALCRGPDGDVWLAWYEWAVMGDLSRDREVFVASLQGSSWSKSLQVSPKDVPTYEDHADPVLSSDGEGGVWVAWAWDYHGTLRDGPPVEENSIFLRHVSARRKAGPILAPGYRGEGRARDYVPSLVVTADGVPWVAWDNSHKASVGYGGKAIFVNALRGEDFGEQTEAAAGTGPLDSQRLLLDADGTVHLLWAQGSPGGWELWRRALGPEGLGRAERVKVKGKVPRYPSGCFDAEGGLWVAYTDVDSSHWKVEVERID